MSLYGRLAIMILGTALITLSFVLVFSGDAKAEDLAGTWEGTCTYYSNNAYGEVCYKVTGSCTLKISQSGNTITDGVLDITITNREKLPITDGIYVQPGNFNSQISHAALNGATLTFRTYYESWTFTASGDQMTGGCKNEDTDIYLGIDSDENGFVMTRTSGDVLSTALFVGTAAMAIIGGLLAIAAAVVGLIAAFLPSLASTGASMTPPPPSASAPAPSGPPSRLPPEQSLGLPLQPRGTTTGNHLVPVDAPQQAFPDVYPKKYPHPPGTNSTMRCPYCLMLTLSPFATGWFCTNVLCPARREWLTKGHTHHEFNNMTWRTS